MRLLLSFCLLAVTASASAAPTAPSAPDVASAPAPAAAPAADKGTLKLNFPAPPSQSSAGAVLTDIRPTSSTPAAAPTASITPSPSPTAGFPMIPAAGGPDAGASSAAASAPNVASSSSGPQVGQPVTLYVTLADANKAGVDPLPPAAAPAVPAPAAEPAPSAFDWKNPQAYLAWVQSHREVALKYAAMVLVAALAAWLFVRRKAR